MAVTTKKVKVGGTGLNRLMDAEGVRLTLMLFALTLIITLSTVLLVIAAIFLGSFRLDLLTMASNNFLAAPILMVVAGGFTFIASIVGFVLIFKKRVNLYISLSVVLLIALVLQIGAIVLTFLLRDNIDRDFNKVNVDDQLSRAKFSNSSERGTWDTLQHGYKCCGGRGVSGYKDWEAYLGGPRYPDSCCNLNNPYKGCGDKIHRDARVDINQRKKIYERIHVKGCITAIRSSLDNYVMPLLLAWAIIGIIVSIALLFLLVFSVCIARHMKQLDLQGTRLHFETRTGNASAKSDQKNDQLNPKQTKLFSRWMSRETKDGNGKIRAGGDVEMRDLDLEGGKEQRVSRTANQPKNNYGDQSVWANGGNREKSQNKAGGGLLNAVPKFNFSFGRKTSQSKQFLNEIEDPDSLTYSSFSYVDDTVNTRGRKVGSTVSRGEVKGQESEGDKMKETGFLKKFTWGRNNGIKAMSENDNGIEEKVPTGKLTDDEDINFELDQPKDKKSF